MHAGRADALDQFRAALIAHGIVPPDPIIADGGLHRCHAEGRHGRGDAAYVLHLDGLPAGGFTNWRDGRGWESWRFDGGVPLSMGERDALRARMQAGRAQCQAEAVRRHHVARQRASRYWHRASAAPRDHPYLVRKGVQACGLRVYRGALVVPVQDADGVLHSLQFIGTSGAKRFLKGGRVQGLSYWIGGSTGDTVCIAEG